MNDKRLMDGSKIMYHYDRVRAWFERVERIAPIHIDCGIAKFCQIKCVGCYGMYQNPSKEYISKKALLGLITDAADIGVKSLALIGDGEPTCNPYLYDALDESKKHDLEMCVSTNGFAVNNEKKAMSILESCTWMRFCIWAGTREGYWRLHGRDYFDKVVQNIKRMVMLKRKNSLACDIGLQMVFAPRVNWVWDEDRERMALDDGDPLRTIMCYEVKELAKFAVDTGVDYLVVKQCSLPDTGESGMIQFQMSDYDLPDVMDALAEAERYSNDKTDIIIKRNVMALKGVKKYRGCPSIPFISEISGNGDWYPCGYMFGNKPEWADYKFGNLHEKGLREIWESNRYWNICRMMRDDFNVQERCKGCCRQDMCNIKCDALRRGLEAWQEIGFSAGSSYDVVAKKVEQYPGVKGINFP